MFGPDFLGQGPHAGFIVGSYLLTAATVLGLIVWVVVDHRQQRAVLADLERRGLTRRSTRQGDQP
ncbi:heme exporter protein CcmD [Phreatobacter aquaticus]|uniref:Heme exporter protein D n=1 Tax=Phreatobacter aquaticus TaxID=2570229 RepID=A0A4D7QHF4_9HYPH|nr:heme exporter protein CcmD [Phreatobacter aquaticus]QCK85113.1 heme exporter protein CcmD [Phreatobacter aquaticus]